MPIDFSKINLSVLPKGGNVVKAPPKKGRIDYGAIKLSNIYTPSAVKTTPKPVAVSATPFIGRPLVTPVEQQRMKAAVPKPTSRLSLWVNGKTVEQRTLEGKQMTAALAGKSLFDGFKEGVDSYNNATAKGFMGSAAPAQGGITGNRWVDLAGSLATMGAVIQTGVQVVGGIVSAINFTRAMNSKWNWPTVEGGTVTRDIAVRVAQTSPDMDKGTAGSIASLVARTGGNRAQLNALASNTSALSRSLNQISLAAQNPSPQTIAQNIIPAAVRVISQTGIFQAIPMPAGLVHSTAPAIPMGGKTQPAIVPQIAQETPIAKVTAPPVKETRLVVPKIQPTKSYNDLMAEEEAAGRKLEATPRVVDKTIPALDIKKANLVDVTGKVDLKSVQVKFPLTDAVYLDPKHRTVAFFHGTTPLEAIAVDKPQLKDWYGIDGAKLLGEITQPAPIVQSPVAQIATTAKQPWEMTRKEFISAEPKMAGVKGQAYQAGVQHSLSVKQALAEGKSVPPEVLAEYPDLARAISKMETPAAGNADFWDKFSDMVNKAKIKDLQEMAGQDILQNIEDRNDTPQHVSEVFWRDTYPALPPKLQAKFNILLSNNLGMKKPTALSWGQFAGEVDLGNEASTLRGTDRGFVALMEMTTQRLNNIQNPTIATPALTTTPEKGTATTISNQKTSISTSTPIAPRVGTQTGAGEVKWGKWIDAVGSRRTDGVGTGQVDTIKTPVTYRLGSGEVTVRTYAPEVTADRGIAGPFLPDHGKVLEIKGNSRSYYLLHRGAEGHRADYAYVIIESRSGGMIGHGTTSSAAIGNAQEIINAHTEDFDTIIEKSVQDHGELANVTNEPFAVVKKVTPAAGMTMTDVSTGEPLTIAFVRKDGVFYETKDGTAGMARPHEIGTRYQLQPITSTSAPAASPSLGNATPAHGLIDYSKIELNGTTSATSPAVLKSVSNTGKGFDNYIQNTAGTTDTSLSGFAKFKEGRDLNVRRIENQFDGLMKTPAGAEWMTMAIEADEVLREEYARPFYIDEAGNKIVVEGEFAPAILNRYLKQYGPNFGKFLQHLQRAGISTEPTLGLAAEKEALKQKHIFDARMSLVNFQKNEPQLFTAYMTAADELGKANALLAEFYKGMISPETYANDKANPHYYVSLSAGKTDVFDRSGVAPLERTHGLTDLDNVVPPLEGLKAVYVDAIRAQGINNAKREAVRSNKNSEVATTELSDSIVHLKENGVERAYDVHDTNVTKSVQNLTLKKPDVPTWEKYLVRSPTTLLRLFATGLNPAFGLYNIMRDTLQGVGTLPLTPKGLVKGTVRAFKSPGLSQWFDSYRDPMMSKGTRALEALKAVTSIITYPNEIGESLTRSVVAESILDRGGTYLDQLHGYFASTGFFALHGTFFNDFIASNIPFTRATIAVVRSAYRNTFYGLPIGDKGGTFSGKQGAEKLAGRNLATIIFTIVSALAVKEAGKEKEYKLLRDRASYFYFPTPSGAWVKLPVPIGLQPIKAITDSLFGYKSDPLSVAGQTLNVLPGLESFMLPPALALFLQLKFNVNFFTGAAIDAAVGTPAANPIEAGIMKATGWTEERTAFVVRAFLADIPSQVQYVFDMVGQGSSTQAFPASKRFIVKDPTTSSNAAVDDFYALVDAAGRSSNPALKHYVNARADAIGKLLHNAKLYPADAKIYMTTATDNIIATFATIAENPSDYGIKKFGPFSWRPSGNYEELAP